VSGGRLIVVEKSRLAAAVAARLVPISLGSDTGGSIRQPAAFCGTIGLKPTYGMVSRFGLVAFASSLDQIGPFANTVDDIALVMEVLSGHDPKDSTSLPIDAPELMKASHGDIKGLRIGIPDEYFADGISEPVRAAVMEVVDKLVELGAVVSHVSMPHTEYTLPAYYIVAPAEASSNLARYDGVRYGNRASKTLSHEDLAEKTREQGFGAEVKRRILIGTYALSAGYYDAFYHKAMQVRTLIQQDFVKAFEHVDVLITPTTPTTAFGIGEKSDDPLAMKLSDICTLSANLAGVPGISIPAGFDDEGLPFGVQLLGPALQCLEGAEPQRLPRLRVRLAAPLRRKPGRPELVRAHLMVAADGAVQAEVAGSQASSRIGSLQGADLLLEIPAEQGDLEAGALLWAQLLRLPIF
jgi:aspartyl-tRNA(Asn)/glutamyl-tRNA(Gln) amidotransferase subunit A